MNTCRFTDYDHYDDAITAGAEDFHKANGVYPNILYANSITFSKLSPVKDDIPEYAYDDPDDTLIDDIHKKYGIISPKIKDTVYEMGGYICYDFGVAYSVDEDVATDEFYFKYIPWEVPESFKSTV